MSIPSFTDVTRSSLPSSSTDGHEQKYPLDVIISYVLRRNSTTESVFYCISDSLISEGHEIGGFSQFLLPAALVSIVLCCAAEVHTTINRI